MRVVIHGHRLLGSTVGAGPGLRRNVHVALQVGREPEGLIPGNASSASWSTEVTVVQRDGLRDFRGPAVQGKRGERFLYLTWGELSGTDFTMFRRAKLMLDDIPRLDEKPGAAGEVVASVEVTDEKGLPRCARVRPPAIVWSLES